MARIILMNPNSNGATTRAMVAIASRVLPGVEGWTAPSGPAMIVEQAPLEAAAELVAAADLPPVDGVIVSAFGDPGRDVLAARMDCPVVGIGAAAARAACAEGRRFAVATTTPGLERSIDALMRAHSEPGAYIGCHFAQGDPLALMQDIAALDAALLAAVQQAGRAGAEAVIIGGGPLGEAADRLADRSPLMLVSPILAAARHLRSLLQGQHASEFPY